MDFRIIKVFKMKINKITKICKSKILYHKIIKKKKMLKKYKTNLNKNQKILLKIKINKMKTKKTKLI